MQKIVFYICTCYNAIKRIQKGTDINERNNI